MFVSGLDEKYDFENDYQLALYFRECLKGIFAFEVDASSTWAEPPEQGYAGRRGHTYEVKRIKCCWSFGRRKGRQISLNRFMYEVLIQLPLFVKPRVQKYHDEYIKFKDSGEIWNGKAFQPSEETKNYHPITFEHFVKHFSTEENILKTLDKLSMIISAERQSGVDEDYDYSVSTMEMM
tara:strand:+ start:3925 stop:4461 length:537 start_codon:yes stop_codon:yes gene_type:complete